MTNYALCMLNMAWWKIPFPRRFHADELVEWLLWGVIGMVAWAAGMLLHRLLLSLVRRLHASRPHRLLASLLQHRVSSKLAFLFPPLLAIALLNMAYEQGSVWLSVNVRLAWMVFVVAVTRCLNALIESVGDLVMSRQQLQNRPMKGVVEILQVVSSGLGIIVVVSMLINKSPLTLLTGLSAFAAVLLLLFRDTILGFVAGVMLAKSDMVRIGDRIVMERCGAEGIVVDIDLTTVKVQNMDYTMVTIPPYTLLTESFQNWRPLYEDERRRLLVEVWIRPRSVKRIVWNKNRMNTEVPVTNLVLFRRYLTEFLKTHPDIRQDCLQMVRLLPMRPEGIPLQVYAFTRRVAYRDFNEMQSEVAEHVIGMMTEFGLEMMEWQRIEDRE